MPQTSILFFSFFIVIIGASYFITCIRFSPHSQLTKIQIQFLLFVSVKYSVFAKLKVTGGYILWQLAVLTCRPTYKVKQKMKNKV
jgi:hypothetical protein